MRPGSQRRANLSRQRSSGEEVSRLDRIRAYAVALSHSCLFSQGMPSRQSDRIAVVILPAPGGRHYDDSPSMRSCAQEE